MCYDADVFNPLTFIEEAEREINVKDICGSLTECSVNDKIIQMTENEFVMYQSAIINTWTLSPSKRQGNVQGKFKKNLIRQ